MGGDRYYSFRRSDQPLGRLAGGGVRFFVLDSRTLDPEQLDWLQKGLARDRQPLEDRVLPSSDLHLRPLSGGRAGRFAAALEPILVARGCRCRALGPRAFLRADRIRSTASSTSSRAPPARCGSTTSGTTALTARGFDTDYSFMLMEISGDELFFQAISRKGETVDAGVIRKPKAVPGQGPASRICRTLSLKACTHASALLAAAAHLVELGHARAFEQVPQLLIRQLFEPAEEQQPRPPRKSASRETSHRPKGRFFIETLQDCAVRPDRVLAPVVQVDLDRPERRAEVLHDRERRRAESSSGPSAPGGQTSRWFSALLSQCASSTAISRSASTSAAGDPPRAGSILSSSNHAQPWSGVPSIFVPASLALDDGGVESRRRGCN